MSDAVKYFQKNGLQASKQLVEMGFGFVSLEDDLSFHSEQLKRLVESHELVEKCGGVDKVKQYLKDGNVFRFEEKPLMKQAVADVEACKEVPSESN